MKLRLFLLFQLATAWQCLAQGWVHNGAHVVATNGTFMVINGTMTLQSPRNFPTDFQWRCRNVVHRQLDQ